MRTFTQTCIRDDELFLSACLPLNMKNFRLDFQKEKRYAPRQCGTLPKARFQNRLYHIDIEVILCYSSKNAAYTRRPFMDIIIRKNRGFFLSFFTTHHPNYTLFNPPNFSDKKHKNRLKHFSDKTRNGSFLLKYLEPASSVPPVRSGFSLLCCCCCVMNSSSRHRASNRLC